MHCHCKINYLAPAKLHSFLALLQHFSVQKQQVECRHCIGGEPSSADTAVQPSHKFYLLHLFLESLSSLWEICGTRPDANSNTQCHQHCSAAVQGYTCFLSGFNENKHFPIRSKLFTCIFVFSLFVFFFYFLSF